MSLARIILRFVVLLSALASCRLVRASDLALVNAKIYPAPGQPAIVNGSILIHDGKIAAAGPAAKVRIPPGTTVLDCKGLVITAGFWNSHVHIFLPELLHAEKLSDSQLSSELEAM